ncbi:MAG: PEP-CTERM sorting domain-containing protein [Verrucomicrobia bacterium]|nr:PEP-CTERM sorting domain-containing protein [Verrucomicrobiota bacterium]MCH8512731.1 PEP-CTERM sorting domain-containing protein [Kiritimatiellia bacterium]
MNVKKLNTLMTIAALAITPSFGSLITVAEWNFNNFGSTTTILGGTGTTIDADVGDGLFFIVDGPTTGTNFQQNTGGGTEVNASDSTPAGGSIDFRRGERWDEKVFDYRVDTTGLTDIDFSFAMRMTSSAPDSISVAWTTDEGATLNPLQTIAQPVNELDETLGFGWTAFSFDLSGETAVNNQENLWFRFTFSEGGGAASGGTGMVMDNVIVTGVIPEPGTLVLLGIALGSLILFRRRR